jgi:hypothetical protein
MKLLDFGPTVVSVRSSAFEEVCNVEHVHLQLLWLPCLQVLLPCYDCLLDVSTAGVMVTAALLLTSFCTRFPAAPGFRPTMLSMTL